MLYIYYNHLTFADLVRGLAEALRTRQIVVEVTTQIKPNNFMDLYIIFGMNDFNSPVTPHNYIVYQLEQTTGQDQSGWFSPTYLKYLKEAIEVWDYSVVNYQNLQKLGIKKVRYVPLQYMPILKEIQPVPKEIDLLFYGLLNQRRQDLLDQLTQKGLKVVVKSHLWNEERSGLIAKSKVILNLHYYDHSILETTRLSYLLSNRCVVVSEKSHDPILDRWHQPYVALVDSSNLVEMCEHLVTTYETSRGTAQQGFIQYESHPYSDVIPFDTLMNYECFYQIDSVKPADPALTPSSTPVATTAPPPLPPLIDSRDLFEAEQNITPQRELVLKLPKFRPDELPYVSIVTVTYNRKKLFPMAVRNWELFEYPRDKLEWVIVDDSDDGTSLSSLLPKSKQIKYYKLQATGRLSIGQKRNFGCEKASHDYIAFMDDDDYYYPLSIYARIGLLLKYPDYSLVGVTDLDIYDVINHFSARTKGALVSEASMAFKKSFWKERPFPDKFNTLGEGYPFTIDRRDQIIKMPSAFNMIAMTHRSNYTQGGRSYDRFKHVERKDNILSILDTQTRLFIFNIFRGREEPAVPPVTPLP